MARPFGIAKRLRAALAKKQMTHDELCKAFPHYTPRQISQALYEQSWALPGIRGAGTHNKMSYRATRSENC